MKDGMRSAGFAVVVVGALSVFGGTARAQSAPYACNGTPGERMVGTTQSGGVTVPLCVAGPAASAPGPLVDYAGIAWHPDYDDVWFGGGWTQRGRADPEVLALCDRETGGGCRVIGEYSNSYIAIVKAADGSLFYGWGQGAKAARKDARDHCMKTRGAANQPLPCMQLGTYSALTRKLQTPDDLQAARKRYGAGAWLAGTDGYDSRAWFATGHPRLQEATDAALRACRQVYAGRACETFVGGGNVVIQAFRLAGKSGAAPSDNARPETTAKRATQAARASCKAAKTKCVIQSQFDTRTRGLFLHDFKTGRATDG